MIGRRFFLWLVGAASVVAPASRPRADGYGAAFAARRQFPYVMIHRDCGKPAFLMRRKPLPRDLAQSEDAAHLDGTPIKFESTPECDSCGAIVKLYSADVRENV